MKEGDGWISSLSAEEIEELRTPFLSMAFSLYSDFNIFGVLPHGGGTVGERGTVLEAMRILKEEENEWDAWEREKHRRD